MSVLTKKISEARANNQPLFSTLEITQSCNLRCKHCYNFDRRGEESQLPQKFMKTSFAKDTLSQLAELGALSLNITGGEPLLHPDLIEIVTFAKKNNFHIRVKTNGLLLTLGLAKSLFKAGVREIDISLYGTNEEEYLDFCGKGGFEKTIAAIKNAMIENLKVNVSLILHRKNYKKLGQMIKICDELGVFYNVSDEITDRHDKTETKSTLGLSEQNYTELLNGPHAYFFSHENPEKNLFCGCAKTVIGINVHGHVFPCIGAPIFCGDLHQESLKKIWHDSKEMNKIRNLTSQDLKDCSNCEVIEHCSRSSGSALLNTGDYTACDPQALTYAKARKINKE